MARFVPDLATQCKLASLPMPLSEYRFDPRRRWRFDWAWPNIGGPIGDLAAEIEGGAWVNGRHTRGKGFEADCEKYNAAQLAGWRVLRFTPQMVQDGRAITTITRALGRGVNGD